MSTNTNTGMGVEQDERLDARERELRAVEPEEHEARFDEPEESAESEESAEEFEEPEAEFDEPEESDESADGLAEPYIGPGPVAEPRPVATLPPATTSYTSASSAEPATSVPAYAGFEYSDRMREIQLAFIDDPRQAARDADGLLEDLLNNLAADLERRRGELSGGMLSADGRDEAPPTEELRVAVQQTRELVDLLAQARERVQV